ncbi:uncharacterized protein LOC113870210 [Abrus precatorius]|uniref:Uncharacterized protein LOC113870210 n=1 Tax=Abrus precatorius TaxID=3816 RepID=A0A8B8M245_ABRPR|nr:uncharacterized protein LOC113870210 [Abrus precatorius]
MDRCSISMPLMMDLIFLMMGIAVISFANGQNVPPCAVELSPCIEYMNSTNPPDTCCNPIKEIDATQKTCFCELGLTPGVLEGLGTTTAQAVQLLHSCGVNFNITTTCKEAMPGDDEGGACRVAMAGLSFALLMCCFSVLFN